MQHLSFILGGLAVVIGILALLWGVMELVGRVFIGRETVRPTPLPATPAGRVPAHHLAAIAAAVAAITDGRGRVVRVTAAPHRAHAWAQHGRTEQFASHRVRWSWAVPGPPHRESPNPSQDPMHSKGPEGKP